MKRALPLLVVALLVVVAGGSAAQQDVTKIDTDHDLDDDWATSEYANNGVVTGEIDRYDASITVAEDRKDVADKPLVTDFSDWVRIDYDEEIERTIRIYLPAEYGTPYERAEVESITSDHTADLARAEGGKYQAITVHVEGPSTIVLPLEWDGQASYGVIESLQDRYDKLSKYNPLHTDTDWKRIDSQSLAQNGSMVVGQKGDEVLVQVDARPDQPDHHWIPVPENDADQPVFLHVTDDNGTQELVVTATVDDPPAVRYGQETTFVDRLWSEINSAREIPGEIVRSIEIPDWVPVVGDDG